MKHRLQYCAIATIVLATFYSCGNTSRNTSDDDRSIPVQDKEQYEKYKKAKEVNDSIK